MSWRMVSLKDFTKTAPFGWYGVACSFACCHYTEEKPVWEDPAAKKEKSKPLFARKNPLRIHAFSRIIKPEIRKRGASSMRCPYCAYPESKVIDSRPTDESNSIRRRRECLSCGKRFTTYETVESVPMVVVKRDGSRQAFDRNKILNGLLRACEKRPVSLETLEKVVTDIEQNLLNSMDREIPSERVGELVMEELKHVDQVAYVRFASVYRQFKDIDSFMEELNKLLASER
jgi:transcriptional regulator NrdR